MRPWVATVAAALLVLPGPARAEEGAASPRRRAGLVPTIGVGLAAPRDRVRLDLGGARAEETRADTRLSLSLGLAHPVWGRAPGGRIDGHGALGLGPTLGAGRYPLLVREDVSYAFDPAPWLTLRAGLGVGLAVDLTRGAMSYADVAIPFGVTLFGVVELSARPYASLPIASEERAVFAGTQTWSSAPGIAPLDLTLRLRIGALGF